MAAFSGVDAARAQEKARHILVLHPYNSSVRVSASADDALKKRLTERSPQSLEFYAEFLDLGRVPGEGTTRVWRVTSRTSTVTAGRLWRKQ